MRLANLELNGFRAFGTSASLDLDADAVILVGPNGSGKTSVLDGVLWALAGRVPRIAGGEASLVSLYSSSGGARVSATLKSASGTAEVRRGFDGERSSLHFSTGADELRGSAALARICETLWPDAIAADDEVEALTSVLTRSVYLQQDRVREFVEADTEQDRFTAVSELVGAGRVAEFQVQLDRERTAWSRATNERSAELDSMRSRLAALEARLDSLAEAESSVAELESMWNSWWSEVAVLGVSDRQDSSVVGAQASQAIDAAVRRLGVLRRDRAREAAEARLLASELEALLAARVAELPNLPELRERVAADEAGVETARQVLQSAEAAASEERRRQTELRNAQAELQTIAQLALRHLDERCPVCEQEYDQEATRDRLERIAADGAASDESTQAEDLVPAAAERLQQAEAALTSSSRLLREAESVGRSLETREQELRARFEEVGIAFDMTPTSVVALLALGDKAEATEALAARLHDEGEAIAVEVARSSEAARRDEVQREIETVRSRVDELAAEVARRESTGRVAVALLEGLREAGSDLVSSELERVEPLLQQIFSTIDPHPAFRAVRLLARFANRRGRVNAQLEDALWGRTTQSPEVVLSSSQLNGLAVSIFLSLNLGMRSLPLDALILDDPLQSLDDVNLLGLVDLLRRARDHRQVIVSTHDPKFGELLARKLRPVSQDQRTIVYRFVAWGRSGPVIEREDIERDPSVLRIATTAA